MSAAGTSAEVSAAETSAETSEAPPPPRGAELLRQIMAGNWLLTVLAIVMSLVVGGILIAATDPATDSALTYFFARPSTALGDAWHAVSTAYAALFRGGVYDYTATSFKDGIQPLLTSLQFATPLIAAGLGIAVGFRAGVFNIGGQGQMIIGGMLAGWIGFALPMPAALHIPFAILGALVGGALWAGIVGWLKAKTGAHEVIVTIMLNYVAYYFIDYLLHTPVLQAPHSSNPQSPAELPSAVLPNLFGSAFPVNLGFVLVIAATVGTAWLLSRSSLGFKLRAVGENPRAAKVAGIDTNRVIIIALVISGLLLGLAAAYEVLAQNTAGLTNQLDAGIGFNAITVTLLGRSRPWGTFWAGILFGVFEAGGYTMQASQNIDIDIVTIVQSLIVLFIAAPPLVRAIFRLPTPGKRRTKGGGSGSSGVPEPQSVPAPVSAGASPVSADATPGASVAAAATTPASEAIS